MCNPTKFTILFFDEYKIYHPSSKVRRDRYNPNLVRRDQYNPNSKDGHTCQLPPRSNKAIEGEIIHPNHL